MTAKHRCKKRYNALNSRDLRDGFWKWGGAIEETMRWLPKAKRWRIDNGEYATAIAFCPYCGIDLMTLVPDAAKS